VTVWIKICGMTTPEAVRAALDARAEAIGFVFAESKRQVTPGRAAELAQSARGRIRCIAVTRHPEQRAVDEILSVFKPDALQTDWEDLQSLKLPHDLQLIPVLRSGHGEPAPLPACFLFEGPVSGTGVPTDWNGAHAMARRANLILAGGLSPENVAAAIERVRPFGVDVSSGIEQSPGVKSPEKIASFVEAARAAARFIAPGDATAAASRSQPAP
jgi:phosphoribosylanthranilate isomerase